MNTPEMPKVAQNSHTSQTSQTSQSHRQNFGQQTTRHLKGQFWLSLVLSLMVSLGALFFSLNWLWIGSSFLLGCLTSLSTQAVFFLALQRFSKGDDFVNSLAHLMKAQVFKWLAAFVIFALVLWLFQLNVVAFFCGFTALQLSAHLLLVKSTQI